VSELTIPPAELQLRLQAAKPVFERLEADCDRFPSLAPYLRTIKKRMFDPAFNITALWREHNVRDGGASARFASLKLTPKAYLTDCQLCVAAALLDHTTLKVKQIRALVGYSTQGAFLAAFKKWSGGLAPEQYRKRPDRPLGPWSFEPVEPDLSRLLALIDAAHIMADFETAQFHLERAARHPERGAYEAEMDARLALTTHGRGVVRTLKGDVDRAHDDLALARCCYAQAGVLEPSLEQRRRRLENQVPCTTDNALVSALCPDCRRAFACQVGESLRGHLRRALDLVPLDLPWFGVCCDECYEVTWDAFALARYGHLNDANQAWWLAKHVSLEDSSAPKTVGRLIAALAEVDSWGWVSQEDRLKMCDIAVSDAQDLGRPTLALATGFWRSSVLSALARFLEARALLQWQPEGHVCPWLKALHHRFKGIVERASANHEAALIQLGRAADLYGRLDPHLAGLMLTQLGAVYIDNDDFEAGIAVSKKALLMLDERRDSLPSKVAVPIHLAMALALQGKLEPATRELDRIRYDREAYPAFAASELFTGGCVALLAGEAQKAIRSYREAQLLFERQGNLKYAALTATSAVEPLCVLGKRDRGAIVLAQAGRFFEAVGCPRETVIALRKLQALLAEGASGREIAISVRKLAAKHGGRLPPDDYLPRS